jgi:general stress protein YciG
MKKKILTVAQAGKLGGQKTAETHGSSFYTEIGCKGGEKTARNHGSEFFSRNGSKGASIRWGAKKVVEA